MDGEKAYVEEVEKKKNGNRFAVGFPYTRKRKKETLYRRSLFIRGRGKCPSPYRVFLFPLLIL